MSEFDRSLLEPVHEDGSDHPFLGTTIGVLLVVVVAVALISAAVAVRLNADKTAPHTTIAAEPGTSSVVLTDLDADEPLVYWPTIAPEGWEVCGRSGNPSSGDRLCDPNGEGWMRVSLIEAVPTGARPPGPLPDSTLLIEGDTLVLTKAIGEYALSVTANGLPKSSLVQMVVSIPIVGDAHRFAPLDEPVLDVTALSDDEIATILSDETAHPKVHRDRRSFNVFGESVTLLAGDEHTLPGPPITLIDVLFWVRNPRLIDADRAVVIGESESGSTVALWDQAGYRLILEGSIPFDDMRRRTLDTIKAISELAED